MTEIEELAVRAANSIGHQIFLTGKRKTPLALCECDSSNVIVSGQFDRVIRECECIAWLRADRANEVGKWDEAEKMIVLADEIRGEAEALGIRILSTRGDYKLFTARIRTITQAALQAEEMAE